MLYATDPPPSGMVGVYSRPAPDFLHGRVAELDVPKASRFLRRQIKWMQAVGELMIDEPLP